MNRLLTLLAVCAFSACAADFSAVITDGSAAQWEARDAVTETGPFGEKIISITRKDTKGSSFLSCVKNVQPDERFTLNLEYRSNLANSSRDRGAWILATWWNPHGQGIKSQYFILKESSAWVKRSLELQPAPEGANRLNIQIRVQERIGTLALKSIALTRGSTAPSPKKTISETPDFLKSLQKIAEFELVQPAGRAPYLKGPDGTIQPRYSKGNSLPAEFVLPERFCRNPKLYYVIQTEFHYTGEPEKKTVGIFQLGRNMHDSRPNSLALNIWGGTSYFARVTGHIPNSAEQVVKQGFHVAKNEPARTVVILNSDKLIHYYNGAKLGETRIKAPFFWPENTPFHIGAEDRNLSVFPGKIDRFTLGIYRSPFELKQAGSSMFYGKGPHRVAIDINGKIPAGKKITAALTGIKGKTIPLNPEIRNAKLNLPLPAGLQYGWYRLNLKIGEYPLSHTYVLMPERVRREPAEKSPFAGCQGIPTGSGKQTPGEIEDLMRILAESGMRYFRFWLSWDSLADKNGVYDWRGMDRILAAAEKYGIRLYPILEGGKHPYQMAEKPPFSLYEVWQVMPPLGLWAKHVEAVAKRYKGRITEWQILNEPDSRIGFWPFDPKPYVDMLKVSYETLKKVDPGIKVGMGGFCAAFSGDMLRKTDHKPTDSAWGAAEFYACKPQAYYDIVDIHRYSSGFSGQLWDWHYYDMKEMKKYLKNVGDDKKPIWNSETGFVFGTPGRPAGWGVTNVVPIEDHAARIVQWNIQSLAAGICRNFLYIPVGNEAGLVNSDLSPNPAFAAYVNMVNSLESAVFDRDFELGKNIRAYRFRKADKASRVYAWTKSGQEILTLKSDAPVTVWDLWGNPVAEHAKAARIGTIPVLLESKAPIAVENAVKIIDRDFYAKGMPVELVLELRNPSDQAVRTELFLIGDGKQAAVRKENLQADSVKRITVPLKQTPEKLEIGVRYSGGMDFRTVLEKSLNPRTVLDLRNGKTARGVIGRKEQLHVGREVRDDQNRILSNMTWKGANDLSASFELKKNGGRIEFVLNVTDDKVIPTPPGKQPYMYDSLELFVSPDLKKANRNIQTVIDAAGKVVVYSKESLKNFRSKAERTPKGYRITGSFDRPAGKSVGIDFSLNDCDDLRVPRKSAAAFTGNGFNPSSSQGYSILLTE